jgi:hypothetical protein
MFLQAQLQIARSFATKARTMKKLAIDSAGVSVKDKRVVCSLEQP